MSEGLKQKIQKEIDGNVQMLRSKDPKSERRISVLHARIEMLTWVRKELDEAAKEVNQIMCEDYWTSNFALNKVRLKILAVLGVDEKEKVK